MQGHALISLLVATLVWGGGATALVRWTLWLMQADRSAHQLRTAAQALQSASELGSIDSLGESVEGQAGARRLHFSDGTPLLLVETRRSDSATVDPLRGAHVSWAAHWEDPWGQGRSLVIHSFWAASRRTN
jgi:hypothetical protein